MVWQFGGRAWSLRQSREAHGFNDAADFNDNNSYSYSSGAGIVAGFGGTMRINSILSASALGDFGYLMGRSAANNDDYTAGNVVKFATRQNRNFRHMGVSAGLHAKIVSGLSGYLGYEFRSFENAVTKLDYAISGTKTYGLATQLRDISFSGLAARLTYLF